MQKYYFLVIFGIIMSLPVLNYSQNVRHKFGFSTGMVVSSSPFQQLSTYSTNDNWYAAQFTPWMMGSAGGGFAFDISYEAMWRNGFLLRLNTGLQSTGYVKWITDFGGGARIYLPKKIGLSVEAYLSILQTGAKLGIVGANQGNELLPQSQSLYIGLFGFKGRVALEIPISKKATISPFISYAAYPWAEYTLGKHVKTDLFVNGLQTGLKLDSFQIGIEFSFIKI